MGGSPANRLHLAIAIVFFALAPALGHAAAPLAAAAGPQVIDLDGTWRFLPGKLQSAGQIDPITRTADASWKRIRVPANWYLEGWEISGKAWYRRTFDLPARPRGRAVLQFQGVDYFADVWLNGVFVGSHEGYFAPFEFEVGRALKAGGNELLVLVDSPVEDPSDWSLRKRLIKGIFSHHDTRPGGAWSTRGQEHNTGGIWNGVSLRLTGEVALGEPKVRSRIRPDRSAVDVRVRIPTLGKEAGGETEGTIEVNFVPLNFTGETFRETRRVSLRSGHGDQVLDLALPGAALWWPREFGAQNLYRVQVDLRVGGRLSDRREAVTGLRQIEVSETDLVWHVNGVRVFLRGTNYIPTQWLSEMGQQEYARDVDLMRQANINAIRVHAHVGDPRFYLECDRAGMLVWQDFPLQWGYADSEEMLGAASLQAEEMVTLLDNHPSIIAWSMHNEPPWDAWWMKYKYPDYAPEQNRHLDEQLERVVRRLDDSRYVRRASLSAEHKWQGWYSGAWTDFLQPTQQALVTEYGAQALPSLASLQRLFNDDQLFPDTPAKLELWRYRNFQPEETFNNAKIDKGRNIQEFIANSQTYQARLIGLAAESLRRQKYRPVTGVFQFMFVEDWPSMNWGVLDYWRTPKPAYERLARAYQPILPSIAWESEQHAAGESAKFGLWLVNDLPREFKDWRYAWALNCGGARVAAGDKMVDFEADSAVLVEAIATPALAAGACRLDVSLSDGAGIRQAANFHEFTVH
jgi:beta-mannosidase